MKKPTLNDRALSLDDAPVRPPRRTSKDLQYQDAPDLHPAGFRKRYRPYRGPSTTAKPPSPTDHPVLAPYCRAVRGRATQLAYALGIDPAMVCMWIRGKRRICIRRCYHIEELTKGVLTCEMLRPDLMWKRKLYNKDVIHYPSADYTPPPPASKWITKEVRERIAKRDKIHVTVEERSEGC